MKLFTLDDLRRNFRLESDDPFLVTSANEAECRVLEMIGMTYDDLIDTYGCVPHPVKYAAIGLAGELYLLKNEEQAETRAKRLLRPYIIKK